MGRLYIYLHERLILILFPANLVPLNFEGLLEVPTIWTPPNQTSDRYVIEENGGFHGPWDGGHGGPRPAVNPPHVGAVGTQ